MTCMEVGCMLHRDRKDDLLYAAAKLYLQSKKMNCVILVS